MTASYSSAPHQGMTQRMQTCLLFFCAQTAAHPSASVFAQTPAVSTWLFIQTSHAWARGADGFVYFSLTERIRGREEGGLIDLFLWCQYTERGFRNFEKVLGRHGGWRHGEQRFSLGSFSRSRR